MRENTLIWKYLWLLTTYVPDWKPCKSFVVHIQSVNGKIIEICLQNHLRTKDTENLDDEISKLKWWNTSSDTVNTYTVLGEGLSYRGNKVYVHFLLTVQLCVHFKGNTKHFSFGKIIMIRITWKRGLRKWQSNRSHQYLWQWNFGNQFISVDLLWSVD